MSEPDRPPTTYEQIVEAIADLLQTASDWLRQEAESTVREKVVLPLQRLFTAFALGSAAAALVVLAVLALATGCLIFFGGLVGYDVTLWILGGLMLITAGILLFAAYRRYQR